MSSPEFTVKAFQNEYLAAGARDVHAVITVTSADAGDRPADAAELPIAAAAARVSAIQAYERAAAENIQTHGGMGFSWQFDCQLYYRRAKLLALELGSAREWKHRLVAELRTRNAPSLAPA